MEVKLTVLGGRHAGKEIPVRGPKFSIGRADDCQLRPQSDRVSRRHAEIRVEEGLVAVRDLGSTNGTFVNDERIEGERELKNGDRLKIGPLEFEVALAVRVGGKMKPKVQSVQEAAARTVQTAAGEDLDVTAWLNDGEEEEDSPTAAGAADTQQLTTGATAQSDLEDAVEAGDEAQKKEGKKEPIKVVGRFGGGKKPTAESSGAAAAETLKRFFEGK